MPAVPAKSRAFVRAVVATLILMLALLLGASLLAKQPYSSDQVFGSLRSGQLWSEKARYIDDWHAVEAIDDATFIIGEPKSSQYNASYLLVGSERALLIDAGSGERPADIRSMRAVAESLTGKPVMLALSHFHFDHIGDLDAFDGALVHRARRTLQAVRLAENPLYQRGDLGRFRLALHLGDSGIERVDMLLRFQPEGCQQALEEFVREKRAKKALQDLRGIGWEGDLDAMRRSFMPVDGE